MSTKPIIAIMYDFDKTLTDKDQQEYSFIPSLDMTAKEFWTKSDELAKENDMDKILAYMNLMITQAKKKNVPITRESFRGLGAQVELLPGVKSWFKRINDFGKQLGVRIEHYIISSGIQEIMEGTAIAKEFKKIYACKFHYNKSGNADWPAQVVNYTTKTQFVFRINKGVLDQYDDVKINTFVPHEERRVPYANMIYIGDGLTDIPCMTVTKQNGGESIALYHKGGKSKVQRLLLENRVGYVCEANYSKNTELDATIKLLIQKIALEASLREITMNQKKEINEIIEQEKFDEHNKKVNKK